MKISESPGFRTLITLIPFLILLSTGCQLTRGLHAVVVEKIVNSELNKIVVIFGIAHQKGIKKLLKEKESASKKPPQ